MKHKSTKRALVLSGLALLICVSMLLGTTFAWFTDSVTSAGNIIKSGTLDIDLKWADGTEDPADAGTTWTDASTGAIFNYQLWEPGYVQVRHVKIANVGNLALKYQFKIIANGTLETNSAGHTLADAIDVYYADPAVQVDNRNLLTDANKIGTLTQVLANNASAANTAQGVLLPGEDTAANNSADTVTIALKMRENAGNEYKDMSIGTDFSLQCLATQYTYEQDSFDENYDELADGNPDNGSFFGYTSVTAPVAASGATTVGDVATNGVEAEIPAAALNDSVTSVTLVEEPASDSDAVITVNTDDGATASYFDVSLVDQDGNPVAIENGQIVTVQKNVGQIVITEVNHRNTALTTDSNAPEYYEYDFASGILTLHLTSFSPFSMGYVSRFSVFPTLNNKICIGDDALFEAMYEASEAAVTNLESLVNLEALYEADFGFGPLDPHDAICQFMIGGCNGMRPTNIFSWAWQKDYVTTGTTTDQILEMQQAYFDVYKELVDTVEFYPKGNGPGGWGPWPVGQEPIFELEIEW